tara:strand:- start:232 stop:519 length:288 start_codon:yes stop_codon:yes gene_type:complete
MTKTAFNLQKVPKWFEGEVYDEGAVVRNPYSGAECELNALELSIYDMIMGAQMFIEMRYHGDMLDERTAPMQKDMRKGLDWFRTHNAEAYMILLD